MEQVFNLQPLITTLFQAVPVWAIIGFGVHLWIRKSHESLKSIEAQLLNLKTELDSIKLSIAAQGLSNLSSNISDLREAKIKGEMQIEAIFKILDSWNPVTVRHKDNAHK